MIVILIILLERVRIRTRISDILPELCFSLLGRPWGLSLTAEHQRAGGTGPPGCLLPHGHWSVTTRHYPYLQHIALLIEEAIVAKHGSRTRTQTHEQGGLLRADYNARDELSTVLIGIILTNLPLGPHVIHLHPSWIKRLCRFRLAIKAHNLTLCQLYEYRYCCKESD